MRGSVCCCVSDSVVNHANPAACCRIVHQTVPFRRDALSGCAFCSRTLGSRRTLIGSTLRGRTLSGSTLRDLALSSQTSLLSMCSRVRGLVVDGIVSDANPAAGRLLLLQQKSLSLLRLLILQLGSSRECSG